MLEALHMSTRHITSVSKLFDRFRNVSNTLGQTVTISSVVQLLYSDVILLCRRRQIHHIISEIPENCNIEHLPSICNWDKFRKNLFVFSYLNPHTVPEVVV